MYIVLVSLAYFIYVPIMDAFWAIIIYLYIYILYICNLQDYMTPGSPGGGQGIPGISPGSRRTNLEGGSPNWVEQNETIKSQEQEAIEAPKKAVKSSHSPMFWVFII